MDRFRRTNPSVNRIITSKTNERQHHIHDAKIQAAKSCVDCRPGKIKRVENRKRRQMAEDRAIIVDQDNKRLLDRMKTIQLKQQMDCHLQPRNAQSNYGHRLLRVQSINRENALLLHRLETSKSRFNAQQWEDDRKEMEKRIRWMSEFDETGLPKGFKAGTSGKPRLAPLPPRTGSKTSPPGKRSPRSATAPVGSRGDGDGHDEASPETDDYQQLQFSSEADSAAAPAPAPAPASAEQLESKSYSEPLTINSSAADMPDEAPNSTASPEAFEVQESPSREAQPQGSDEPHDGGEDDYSPSPRAEHHPSVMEAADDEGADGEEGEDDYVSDAN